MTTKRKCEFVEDLAKEFICPVCQDAVYDAVETKCCGHHLCKLCSEKIEAFTMACPLCKSPHLATQDSAFMRRQLSLVHVYCTNKECCSKIYNHEYPISPDNRSRLPPFFIGSNLCKWQGKIKDLQSHLDDHCPHTTVICRYNCGVKITRCQKQEHEDRVCRKRPFSCWFCDMKATAEEIDGHAAKCDKRTIECPNKCPATLLQGEVLFHLEQCPLQEILCEFAHVGCKERVIRKDYDSHITNALGMLHHFKLLSKTIATQKKEKKEQEARFEAVTQQVQILTEKLLIKQKEEAEMMEQFRRELQRTKKRLHIVSQLQLQSISITIMCKSQRPSDPFYILGYCMSVTIDRESITLVVHPSQVSQFEKDLSWPLEGVVTLVLLHPKDGDQNKKLVYQIPKTEKWTLQHASFKYELDWDMKEYQHGTMNKEYRLSVKSAFIN